MWIPCQVGDTYNELVDFPARYENERPTSVFNNTLFMLKKLKQPHVDIIGWPKHTLEKNRNIISSTPWICHPSR